MFQNRKVVFFNLTFPDEALATIEVNAVCPTKLSVGLLVPLSQFCLHDETEKFCVTGVMGKAGGARGRGGGG